MLLGYLLTGWCAAVIAAFYLLRLHRESPTLVSFGAGRAVPAEQHELLVVTYRAQQRVAFAVACVAVASGVLLAVVLIGRVAISATLDVTLLTSVVGVAGDLWLGTGAVRFYERVSKKWEAAVRASVSAGKS